MRIRFRIGSTAVHEVAAVVIYGDDGDNDEAAE